MFLDGKRTPSAKFLGAENVKLAHADILIVSIFEEFERLELTKWEKKKNKKRFTLNVHVASVNTGTLRG